MSTAADQSKIDLAAVCQAIAQGKQLDPAIVKRVQDRSSALRRKFDRELSVELIRSVRDE